MRKLVCSLFFTSHAHQFRSQDFLIPLPIAPRADPTKVVLDFKLNSFFAIAHHCIEPKTIAREYEAPSFDVPPRKKELPSLHFLLDSEIS
jgi:hypothetical protein